MESVILVIHLILALAIIVLVLLQRSEGGGLGIGGGGLGNLATAQGAANMLTRMTAIFAAGFFCTSLILGVLAGGHSPERSSILNALDQKPTPAITTEQTPDGAAPSAPTPAVPAEAPAPQPSVPIAE